MRWAVGFVMIMLAATLPLACPSSPAPPNGTDIFRVAVNGTPGSLLSVWGNHLAPTRQAFIAGGFVGVDHTLITDGTVGRLVEYTTGSFTTRCRTDEVLWWTTGVQGATPVVFASGENGRVLTYQNGACQTLSVDVTYPQGAPTFWGMYATSASDLWLVGGSASSAGPKGVVVHYDGTHFTQIANLPTAVATRNLYKIDVAPDGALVIVGEGGLVLRQVPPGDTFVLATTDARAEDNRLFTVSCGRANGDPCYTVGGAGSGYIMRTGDTAAADGGGLAWQTVTALGSDTLDYLPGLNGVWVQDRSNVFIVGSIGFTMHTNGVADYQPPSAPTTSTLHGVGGAADYVLAVGGEFGNTTAAQRGVILARGDASDTFMFDGQMFTPTGTLRTTLENASP